MGDARPRFDAHALAYRAQCERGVELSGEPKSFFLRGRIDSLHQWWQSTGRPTPRFVIDYGCGIGDACPILASTFKGCQVLGVDPSADSVERAWRTHASSSVSFLPLSEFAGSEIGTADLIHVNGVLHHVEPPDRAAFLSAIAELLAPKGVVALFENNPINPGTRWVMSRIPFDRDAVPVTAWKARRLLQAARLRDVDTRYLFYFPRFLKALRPLERHLLRLPMGAQYGVFAVRADEADAA
jgi:SAM-dependent methyltransferase